MVTTQDSTIRSRKPGRINRGDRARFLFERGCVHPVGDSYNYRVDSESGSGAYRVSRYTVEGQERWDCTCPDYTKHAHAGELDHPCKHIQAVWLHRAACRAGFRKAVAA